MQHYHLYRKGSVTFFINCPFLGNINICIEKKIL